MRKLSLVAGLLACLGLASVSSAATAVGLELALLVDVSGSVSTAEFNLQRQGYVNAFTDATIQSDIVGIGGIAVTLVYWDDSQYQVIGWTGIFNATDANNFAAAVLAAGRPSGPGNTAPGSAINFITPQFASNTFIGSREVIDVSGDGAQNVGANTLAARNAALAAGVDTINGLPILGEAGLLAWYQANIQGGTNSFTLSADTFEDFDAAIKTKIDYEVTGEVPPTPLPASWAMGALLIGGLAIMRKVALKKA